MIGEFRQNNSPNFRIYLLSFLGIVISIAGILLQIYGHSAESTLAALIVIFLALALLPSLSARINAKRFAGKPKPKDQ